MKNKKPKINDGDVELMMVMLVGGKWKSAEQLAVKMFGKTSYSNKRNIRAIAEASEGQIISSDLGYKLTTEATSEECSHCVNRLISQAERMKDRADKIVLCRTLRCKRILEANGVQLNLF